TTTATSSARSRASPPSSADPSGLSHIGNAGRRAAHLRAYAHPGGTVCVSSCISDQDGGMDSPRIRPATEDDVDAIARVWHAAWGDGHKGHVPDELSAHRTFES